MRYPRFRAALLALLLAAPLAVRAQAVPVKEARPGLLSQAKITPDSATRIAQARLPKAKVQQAEIEVEDGRLIYSFDMKMPGKSGIEEVQVDAKTGAVLGVEHEDAAAEARERKADSAKARP
jgi:uncharacterized membrane protein YkoI